MNKIKIKIFSGKGGNGKICFIKNFINNFIPSGGNGGNGGDVYLLTDLNINLNHFKQFNFRSENGFNGKCNFKNGRNGINLILRLPLGVLVRNIFNDNIIYNSNLFKKLLILKGGLGGMGNGYLKTKNYNNLGKLGNFINLELDFNLISDIILLGLPNSGKSSFINFFSNNNISLIKDYNFSTLNSILGEFKINNKFNFIILDIPGIIKNSYHGLGLGLNFLKNINFSKIILHIIDLSFININFYFIILNIKIVNFELYKNSKYNFYKTKFLIFNKFDNIFYKFKKFLMKNFFYLINLYYYKFFCSLKKKYGYKLLIKFFVKLINKN